MDDSLIYRVHLVRSLLADRYGMTITQWLVLVAVDELENTIGRCIIAYLVVHLKLSRDTIVKVLNQLCGKDYVARIDVVNPYKSNRYQTTLSGRILIGKTKRLLSGDA